MANVPVILGRTEDVSAVRCFQITGMEVDVDWKSGEAKDRGARPRGPRALRDWLQVLQAPLS